jgi:hypothetical protein
MNPIQTAIKAWSREDLVQALVVMMKIAGWALAIVWAAYVFRFSTLLGPIHTFAFGQETAQQIADAKAAWGQLGDFVGGTLNPFVSLLALVGLVFTILMQHEAMTQVQKDSAESQKALAMQVHFSLQTARLHSLTAALEVTTELHRQAVKTSHLSAIDLLEQKTHLAGQIIQINEALDKQANMDETQISPKDQGASAS